MFILTNINVDACLAKVFDTTDGTEDIVSLDALASLVKSKKHRVYGVASMHRQITAGDTPLPKYGIVICVNEAKRALVEFYMSKGVSKEQAYIMAGLVA